MASITSANSALTFTVDQVYPNPVSMQGYAVDDAFKSDAVSQVEVMMGVDGHLSKGFVFNPYKMTLTFQADSDSIFVWDTVRQIQEAQVDVFEVNGVLTLPAIKTQYTFNNGALTSAHPFPDGKKVLQPMSYELTFESIVSSPTA